MNLKEKLNNLYDRFEAKTLSDHKNIIKNEDDSIIFTLYGKPNSEEIEMYQIIKKQQEIIEEAKNTISFYADEKNHENQENGGK